MPARSGMKANQSIALPAGVSLRPLTTHPDNRGDLTEVFRNEWHGSPLPVQWLVSRTEANVLRGVHVHARCWDYLCVIAGEMIVGLHDLRPTAPTARSTMLHLNGARLQMLVIPTGVAHGFYSPGDSTFVVGASAYHDPSDHGGCRWDAPELAFDWPCAGPELSARDRGLGSYTEMRAAFLAAAAIA